MADDQPERRRDASEIWRSLGAIDAQLTDNSRRHDENVERLADIQGQVHEIKHGLNNHRQMVEGLAHQLTAHIVKDETSDEKLMRQLADHALASSTGIAELRDEIVVNRERGLENYAALDKRLEVLDALDVERRGHERRAHERWLTNRSGWYVIIGGMIGALLLAAAEHFWGHA